ncbi:MAG: DUF192 domain-containing protein [Spirochaetaceae bacterium]|nr:MAG: DUF192 domain-containing protein [Spirochaetaceae bacterium]
MLVLAALATATGFTGGACRREAAPAPLSINGHQFTVEIADTPESRSRGLMHRDRLEPRHGMLFVFEDDAPRSFWMRDTSIPLSIAFIRRDGMITEIHDMQPFSLEPVNSSAPVRYALEVNQGEFRELGIRAGARVELPPRLR